MGPTPQRMLALFVVSVALADYAGEPVDPDAVAGRFVRALNAGDVKALLEATSDPFFFRDQKWASATDGAGFVLGEAADQTIRGAKDRKAFFAVLVKKVQVEHTDGARVDASKVEKTALEGADPHWKGLLLVEFWRSQGDVVHSVIVGVDPASGFVRAFYAN